MRAREDEMMNDTASWTREESHRGARRRSPAPPVVARVGTLILLLGTLAVPSLHALQAADPVDEVRERNETVARILDQSGDSVSEETRERLKDVINGLLDFEELSRRALRSYWDERTDEERNQFIEVFRELVRNSSVRKLEIYEADSTVYQPAEIEGDEARIVTHAHRGDGRVEIVYRMHRVDGEWKAWDVIIDGSSTLRTYQDSFQREIRATSYQAMYNRMVERLAQDRGSAPR